jgi:mRNA interferase RelE/StbE
MRVKYNKKFLKELSKLPNKYAKNIEDFVFDELPNYENIELIGKVEKMRGYQGYYKVRFGNYRVGIKKIGNEIIIATVQKRGAIYKFFP